MSSSSLKEIDVLYVEDEAFIREQLSELLESDVNNLVVAEDGVDGVAKFHKQKPQLIITDIQMPNKNGFEMIQDIKQIDPNVCVIVISAFDDSELLLKSFEVGVDKYLVKPIDYKKLSKQMQEIATKISNKKIAETVTAVLEKKIDDEVQEHLKTKKLLEIQRRFAQVGEVVSSITHQWKQPLNFIKLATQDLNEAMKCNELDEDYINFYSNKVLLNIDFMDKTMNDFKNFFRPQKIKNYFNVYQSSIDAMNLVGKPYEKENIEIIITGDKDLNGYGFSNEYMQVQYILLNNSRDVLKNKNGEKKIYIKIAEDNSRVRVDFCDNGGGINSEIMPKIFDPYFSTKDDTGTGIGLYLAKVIIEQNMQGEILVKNTNDGVCFSIFLPSSPN